HVFSSICTSVVLIYQLFQSSLSAFAYHAQNFELRHTSRMGNTINAH
ncbi:hypothetical protein D027_2809B, partial [Vibrio parahaemolyticus 861]